MRASPSEIAWLQRALRHEFAASRQFTLQAVVARRLGERELAAECELAATDELRHARELATALVEAGAAPGDGAPPSLPVGSDVVALLSHARDTEAQAVRLYREAARTARGVVKELFEAIGAEEVQHLDQVGARLRALVR